MTFLPNEANDKRFNLDLFSTGFDKEMDVIHHFIKNIFLKKAELVSIEIFETPPQAILTLAKHPSLESLTKSEKPTPTHRVKISVQKHAAHIDDYNVTLDVQSYPKKRLTVRQAITHHTHKIMQHIRAVTST